MSHNGKLPEDIDNILAKLDAEQQIQRDERYNSGIQKLEKLNQELRKRTRDPKHLTIEQPQYKQEEEEERLKALLKPSNPRASSVRNDSGPTNNASTPPPPPPPPPLPTNLGPKSKLAPSAASLKDPNKEDLLAQIQLGKKLNNIQLLDRPLENKFVNRFADKVLGGATRLTEEEKKAKEDEDYQNRTITEIKTYFDKPDSTINTEIISKCVKLMETYSKDTFLIEKVSTLLIDSGRVIAETEMAKLKPAMSDKFEEFKASYKEAEEKKESQLKAEAQRAKEDLAKKTLQSTESKPPETSRATSVLSEHVLGSIQRAITQKHDSLGDPQKLLNDAIKDLTKENQTQKIPYIILKFQSCSDDASVIDENLTAFTAQLLAEGIVLKNDSMSSLEKALKGEFDDDDTPKTKEFLALETSQATLVEKQAAEKKGVGFASTKELLKQALKRDSNKRNLAPSPVLQEPLIDPNKVHTLSPDDTESIKALYEAVNARFKETDITLAPLPPLLPRLSSDTPATVADHIKHVEEGLGINLSGNTAINDEILKAIKAVDMENIRAPLNQGASSQSVLTVPDVVPNVPPSPPAADAAMAPPPPPPPLPPLPPSFARAAPPPPPAEGPIAMQTDTVVLPDSALAKAQREEASKGAIKSPVLPASPDTHTVANKDVATTPTRPAVASKPQNVKTPESTPEALASAAATPEAPKAPAAAELNAGTVAAKPKAPPVAAKPKDTIESAASTVAALKSAPKPFDTLTNLTRQLELSLSKALMIKETLNDPLGTTNIGHILTADSTNTHFKNANTAYNGMKIIVDKFGASISDSGIKLSKPPVNQAATGINPNPNNIEATRKAKDDLDKHLKSLETAVRAVGKANNAQVISIMAIINTHIGSESTAALLIKNIKLDITTELRKHPKLSSAASTQVKEEAAKRAASLELESDRKLDGMTTVSPVSATPGVANKHVLTIVSEIEKKELEKNQKIAELVARKKATLLHKSSVQSLANIHALNHTDTRGVERQIVPPPQPLVPSSLVAPEVAGAEQRQDVLPTSFRPLMPSPSKDLSASQQRDYKSLLERFHEEIKDHPAAQVKEATDLKGEEPAAKDIQSLAVALSQAQTLRDAPQEAFRRNENGTYTILNPSGLNGPIFMSRVDPQGKQCMVNGKPIYDVLHYNYGTLIKEKSFIAPDGIPEGSRPTIDSATREEVLKCHAEIEQDRALGRHTERSDFPPPEMRGSVEEVSKSLKKHPVVSSRRTTTPIPYPRGAQGLGRD